MEVMTLAQRMEILRQEKAIKELMERKTREILPKLQAMIWMLQRGLI